jgi:hypothetical protein
MSIHIHTYILVPTAVGTGMILVEPGKYSFYVGKRPHIAHYQLQQYYVTAAIAFMLFAVFCRHKNCIKDDPTTRLHIFFKFSVFYPNFLYFQCVVAVPGNRVWRIIVNTGFMPAKDRKLHTNNCRSTR